jgi:galacturan 1,4-alpha-galacturonidase
VTWRSLHLFGAQFNFVYNSTNVSYDKITINTHSYSNNPPSNSDGWDIYRSSYISITNSVINNCMS